MQQHLLVNNIVMSQLTSWAYEFRDVSLVDVTGIRALVDARNE